MSLGKLIQKGRNDKGMTQKELATKICEKPQVINEYEQGKGIPNNQILIKIEKAIGVKLRGKDKGKYSRTRLKGTHLILNFRRLSLLIERYIMVIYGKIIILFWIFSKLSPLMASLLMAFDCITFLNSICNLFHLTGKI